MVISAVTFILRQLCRARYIYFVKYICAQQMYILRQKPHREYKFFQKSNKLVKLGKLMIKNKTSIVKFGFDKS